MAEVKKSYQVISSHITLTLYDSAESLINRGLEEKVISNIYSLIYKEPLIYMNKYSHMTFSARQ